jgi:hypothetical protein
MFHSLMSDFDEVARTKGMQGLYQEICQQILAEPSFLSQPVRILDAGGGVGEVGHRLKQMCEARFGPMNDDDFSTLIDYTNLDADTAALARSPKRTVHDVIERMFASFEQEAPFDVILRINENHEPPYARQLMTMRMPEEYRAAVAQELRDLPAISCKLTLMNTALLLRPRGAYIWSTFTNPEHIAAIRKEGRRLGLERESEVVDSFDDDVLAAFAKLETGRSHGRVFDEKVKSLRDSYHIVTMRLAAPEKRAMVLEKLPALADSYDRCCNHLDSVCRTFD